MLCSAVRDSGALIPMVICGSSGYRFAHGARRYWGVKLFNKRLKLIVIEEEQALIKQNVLCLPAGNLKHKISP